MRWKGKKSYELFLYTSIGEKSGKESLLFSDSFLASTIIFVFLAKPLNNCKTVSLQPRRAFPLIKIREFFFFILFFFLELWLTKSNAHNHFIVVIPLTKMENSLGERQIRRCNKFDIVSPTRRNWWKYRNSRIDRLLLLCLRHFHLTVCLLP